MHHAPHNTGRFIVTSLCLSFILIPEPHYISTRVCLCMRARMFACVWSPDHEDTPPAGPFLSPYISPSLCLSTCPYLWRLSTTPLSGLCGWYCDVGTVLSCMYSGTRMDELHRSQVCYSGSYMYIPKHTQKRHTLLLSAQPYYFPYTVNVYLRSHTRLFYWFPGKNKHESYRRFHSIGTVHDTILKFNRVEWIKSTCDILPVLLCVVLIM